MENSRSIMFKKTNLLTYALITEPGKYELEVANNVSEANLVTDEDGSSPRYIVNLKAIAKDKHTQVLETFAGADEVPIENTNGLFMTATIWKNLSGETRLPIKGEKVDANIDYVASREGEEVLRVKGLRIQAARTAQKFSFEGAAVAVSTGSELVHAQ